MSHGPYKEYVVDGAEMSCTACSARHFIVPPSLPASIHGGFYIHRIDTGRVKIQSKLVCTEEDKKLITKAPLYCMNTGMNCTPVLDEWLNPRGRAANVKTRGYHFLLDDAVVKCKKGNGTLKFINSGQHINKNPQAIRVTPVPSKVREIGFAVLNPYKAHAIGEYKRGGDNISTIAVLFASNINLPKSVRKEGTQVNAFRHALWQAIISSEYGENVSEKVGSAHEENPSLLRQLEIVSGGELVVSHLMDIEIADEIVDLQNNIIGRKLGCDNSNLNNSELAKKLLQVFKESGLYVAENYADTHYYKIKKVTIDQETYDTAIDLIENGLDPNDKDRQNKRG